MKKSILLSASLILSIFAFGQTSIEPTQVQVDDFDPNNFEAVAYSFVNNNGNVAVDYTWTRNTIDITSGWTSAVCDINQCYLDFVSSQDFTLESGSTGNLDVHLYPGGIEGSALIEVVIEDNDNEENVVTGVYLFSTSLLSTTSEKITNALKIYPNPVISEFFIEGSEDVQRIEIYNIAGKLVKQVQSFGQGSINVDNLGTGNYIVRMWDDTNAQISTNVLTVQ
jgi:hypothetical protein